MFFLRIYTYGRITHGIEPRLLANLSLPAAGGKMRIKEKGYSDVDGVAETRAALPGEAQ